MRLFRHGWLITKRWIGSISPSLIVLFVFGAMYLAGWTEQQMARGLLATAILSVLLIVILYYRLTRP